jgi:hypothetical protein
MMTVKAELAVLGTLITLLGMVSHLAVFLAGIEWNMLAPLLVCIYPALAFLVFLIINSFELDLNTCLRYLFVLVMLYCLGLFTAINIVESVRRKYRPLIWKPQEIIHQSSILAPLEKPEYACDKAPCEITSCEGGQGIKQEK